MRFPQTALLALVTLSASFLGCDKIKEKLGATPLPIQIPIGKEDQFKGLVDLVTMKALVWQGEENGAKFETVEIPADVAEDAAMYREELISVVSEFDDKIMEQYMAQLLHLG